MIAIATQYETCLVKPKQEEVNMLRRVNNARVFQRFDKPKQGYQNTRFQSAKAADYRNKPKFIPECYKCHKKGHYSRDCRVQKPIGKSERPQWSKSAIGGTRPYEQTLTLSTAQPSDSLLRVNGTIDGRIDVQFTLDSGSTVSLMSKRIAQANGLKIMPSEIKIKSANNAVTPVVGVTEALSVDIQGHTCPIIMVIMEHDDHEVLLGLDWFMVTGASLHPKFKVLRFPGVSVPLESHNEEQWNINEFDDVEEVLALEVADASDIEGDTDWYIDNDIKMEPSEKLNQNERIKFDELKKVATRSFATNYDSLGCCTLSKHEIRLLSRNPVYSHPYRKSGKERDNIKEEVDKLLKAKIIRPSRSPYASPVILIPKKDGTNRMCVDYRKLNLQTIPEQWPLPRITDILDGMVGSSWFTMIDLKNGYYQIAMSASSIEKTAFVTPDGHYEFLRLPFGLKNAPSHFSKIMQQTLGDLSFVKFYLDDIPKRLIFTLFTL